MKLSVVMPVYNEEATVLDAVKRVLDTEYPCPVELVIVDDGSADRTPILLKELDDERVVLFHHDRNQGKGAAVRTGTEKATGDYIVICDADLEYSPEDIPALLEPVLDGTAEVVYGTRNFGSHTAFSFWYVMGNKAVTFWANLLFNAWLSDIEVCFKLMPTALYQALDVRSSGFDMEAEVTAKLLRAGYRPFELPVNYVARGRDEGKKLTWQDGVEALWVLLRWRLARIGNIPGPKVAKGSSNFST